MCPPKHFDRQRRTKSETSLDAERLRVVQLTMRTVQGIVSNCFNELQLLRLDAEGFVPQESLALFDRAIGDALAQLNALGNLQKYAEKRIAMGLALDAGIEHGQSGFESRLRADVRTARNNTSDDTGSTE